MRFMTRFSSLSNVLFAGLFGTALAAGCSMEDWNWGGRDQGTKTDKPVTKAQPAPPKATAGRPVEKTAEKPSAEDAQAEQVNARIAEYSERMNTSDQTNYDSNDINSKIARQQDPNRRNRIRKVAEETKTPPGGETGATEVRPSALTGDAEDRPPVPQPPRSLATGEAKRAAAAAAPTRETAGVEPPEDTTSPISAMPPRVSPNPETSTVPGPGTPDTATSEEPKTEPVAEPKVARMESGDASTGPAKPSNVETENPVKPPVLEEVKVTALPETGATPENKPGPEAPRMATNTPTASPPTVDAFKERLQELESRVRKAPDNLEDQYRLRLMYLVSGEEDRALAPIDGANAETQEVIQAHLRALIAAQSSAGRDPALSANQQLERVEELRNLIRSRADLMVPKVVLCTAIEGFGRYTPIEPTEFKAGQKNRVLLYIEVDNFHTERTPSGMYRTLLSVRESLWTKSGEELWSMQDANIEDLARQQRRDFYLTIGELTIPKTLSPGEYLLKVEVTDVLAEKINSNVAKFKIVP